MKTINLMAITIIFITISCTPTIRYFSKNVENDAEGEAIIGSDMISWEEGQKKAGGDIISGIRRSLVYGGATDNIINIQFREYYLVYDVDYPKYAFDQELKYDLSESDIILYRDLRIKVINAEAQRIKFVVLEGPQKPIYEEFNTK